MIRKRINTLLNKLSDAQLKRIYKYIKYVYTDKVKGSRTGQVTASFCFA